MRLGENYLTHNPEPGAPRVNLLKRAWRKVLALTVNFTEGDDLSHYNTITNWFAKQGQSKFSVLKIGEGNSPNPNSKLWEFSADAQASGTVVMAYWFFRGNVSGVTQWQYAVPILDQLAASLGYKPVIWADVETVDNVGNTTRLVRLKDFLDGATLWNPGKVGIYSSPGFANLRLSPAPAWINEFWHWVAHWTSAALPTQPTGWNVAQRKLWQYAVWNNYAWATPVPGADPDVDNDRFFGTESELRAFAGIPTLTLEQRVTALEALAHTH